MKGKNKDYPSLYDAFELGDRVMRKYKSKTGSKEYKGIILAINDDNIEVYWDTQDGKFRPKGMNVTFTTCPLNEIFSGNEKYTPIERYQH